MSETYIQNSLISEIITNSVSEKTYNANIIKNNDTDNLSSPIRNKIICGDILDVIRTFSDGSIDLVVTSPPYNLKNSTGNGMKDGRGGKWKNAELVKGYADYDDNMPHE